MSRTIQAAHLLLEDGWASPAHLTVADDGVIERVDRGPAADPDLTLHGHVVPGMPNVHSHAHQRGLVGYADRMSATAAATLWSWRTVMYEHVLALGPDDLQAYATLAYIEMLRSGYTSVGEFHYLHHDPAGARYASLTEMSERIVAASQTAGIALTLLPVLYTAGGIGRLAEPEQRRFTCTVDELLELVAGLDALAPKVPGMCVGVAPHSLRAVAPEQLAELLDARPEGPIHIHASERTEEVEEVRAGLGARPVQWLLEHAAVSERWCVIHATHLTKPERKGLASRGTVVGLCPLTEANLADGRFPLSEYRHEGGRFAVGTDANHLIDLAGELRMLEYGQRLATHHRETLLIDHERSVATVLHRLARQGGAQAISQPTGRIAPGWRCDLVELDATRSGLLGQTDATMLDAWIFSTGAEPVVSTVVVAGRPVVRDGHHPAEHEARTRVAHVMRRLHQTS